MEHRFQPVFPYQLSHMVLAAFPTTALVVGVVGALHLLRDKTDNEARRMFSMAMWLAVIVTPIQFFAGHEHALNTLEHQLSRSWPWKVIMKATRKHGHRSIFSAPRMMPSNDWIMRSAFPAWAI